MSSMRIICRKMFYIVHIIYNPVPFRLLSNPLLRRARNATPARFVIFLTKLVIGSIQTPALS